MGSQTIDDATTAARQLADLTRGIQQADLGEQTPCSEWDVAALLDHTHVATLNFTQMARGEQAQWDLEPPEVPDRGAALRSDIDALVRAWADGAPPEAASMAVAEYAVHAWDLATALGAGTDGLDQGVAERAHAFMKEMLADDQREPVFGPEQEPASDADAYGRLAAFAGRSAS